MNYSPLFKKILLPIDLNGECEEMLSHGIALSEWANANLIILYAYRLLAEEPLDFSVQERYTDTSIKHVLEQKASERFKEFEKETLMKSIVSYQFLAEVGFMGDRILANTKMLDIDLVVLHKSLEREIEEKSGQGFELLRTKLDCPILSF